MHRSIQRDFLFGFWVHHNAEKIKNRLRPPVEIGYENRSLVTFAEERRNYRAGFRGY